MKFDNNDIIEKGVSSLVQNCAVLKPEESVLIICDKTTLPVAEAIYRYAKNISRNITIKIIPKLKRHGQEPPSHVKLLMQSVDIIFGLTKQSMAHTEARHKASECGVRYLSLPDYSLDLLMSPALHIDFHKLTRIADDFAIELTNGKSLSIKSKKGTDFKCSIYGRIANSAPGWCQSENDLASPPDAETNIAIVEDSGEGIIVVDGSIPCDEIGLLDSPVILTVKNGMVKNVAGKKAEILLDLFDAAHTPKSRIIAEFGIGLNPLARLKGNMLEDEGAKGTIHIGIGSNFSIGGKNAVPFHLDHVVTNPSVLIDEQIIIENGKFCKEV